MSRDGKKMVLKTDDSAVLLYDVENRRPLVPYPLETDNFESWNPDGSQYVGVFGGKNGTPNLKLFDGNTGVRSGTIPLGGAAADHPDWSPDGLRILFTEVGVVHDDDQSPERGGISYVDKLANGWSPLKRLVPAEAGKNRYYPATAPDGSFVVYNESTCPEGLTYDTLCNADSDPSARLWAVRLPPSNPTPIELALANRPGKSDGNQRDLMTSYPKWSPFVFSEVNGRRLLWLTFSSSRRYGLRPQPPAASRPREPRFGHLDLDGGRRSRSARERRRPELPRVLSAIPRHHDVEPHRPVDGRLCAMTHSYSSANSSIS